VGDIGLVDSGDGGLLVGSAIGGFDDGDNHFEVGFIDRSGFDQRSQGDLDRFLTRASGNRHNENGKITIQLGRSLQTFSQFFLGEKGLVAGMRLKYRSDFSQRNEIETSKASPYFCSSHRATQQARQPIQNTRAVLIIDKCSKRILCGFSPGKDAIFPGFVGRPGDA
jgi:hypothetical protein